MRGPSSAFRRRLAAVAALLLIGVTVCIGLAVAMSRRANRTVYRLARVEVEATHLARQFRGAVDDLHGSLLRIGSEPASDNIRTIEQQRRQLAQWLTQRLNAAPLPEEQQLLQRFSAELTLYFQKLDDVAADSEHYTKPISREMLVLMDDAAVRLQGLADAYAALHDASLRELMQASLQSVEWLRDVAFLCLALLGIALAAVVVLLYRDVVRPLRAQLVANERLLVQREKLAALGTLAAGVAHEIRNPLTAIKARLYTLRRAQVQPDAMRDAESIGQEVERLERIVRDVLGYARPADPKLVPLELAAWLREFGAFVANELQARRIELRIDILTTARVLADPDQLRQVMLNLVRNAQDAFGDAPGQVILSLRREEGELRGKDCEFAELSVIDNGPGIPVEIQPRLFDPFFTTKSSGTGLGLSIVATLVENLNGEIVFQTAPRAGTRFSVRLPLPQT